MPRPLRWPPGFVVALSVGACGGPLPPAPQVLVVVDTDLSPNLATKLRVDLYSDRGVWFSSREFTRASARDWPATFGIATASLSGVFLRARVYPEGHVRDYLGERFTDRSGVSPPSGPGPRLLLDGQDETPSLEPSPDVTIDRVVALTFEADTKRVVRVVLHGACAGTMARIGVRGDDVDPDALESCAETEAVRAAPQPGEVVNDESPPSVLGTWAERACDAAEASARICVPGGAFVFGSATIDEAVTEFPPRERIAKLSRFSIDKDEVTVADYRRAVEGGFAPPAPVRVNDGTLTADPVDGCAWTSSPRDREALALSCVPWATARAYCQSRGGDLPTEAQWEYAATQAGRSEQTPFPWGNDEPSCKIADFGRAYVPPAPGVCQAEGSGPLAAGVPAGDRTPLGIRGLAGGVSEWMLDSPAPLEDPCWTGAPLADPACTAESARRSIRGGAWAAPPLLTQAAVRLSADRAGAVATLGFRCVYEAP